MRQAIPITVILYIITLNNAWGQIQDSISVKKRIWNISGNNIYSPPSVNVGIGTPNPTKKLTVQTENNKYGFIHTDGTRSLGCWVGSCDSIAGAAIGTLSNHALHFFTNSGAPNLTIHPSNKVYVASSIEINGTTITKVLTVTGGADLAESFTISDEESIPKGAVVVIDKDNPGHLKLSQKAYDTCVAGVVSGAGGINPGLTLKQDGKIGEGLNVALTGCVYTLATASNNPIKPGDLLTTSDIPGHAMKATNRELSHGAIIGKSMTPLVEGKSLVLVLVNLQ